MKQPLVTIVTPSYNQGPFIRATIESVLAQDYPNIEYIIMDGGSHDETAAIAKEYAGKLVFISEKDRGQSHAINKGFRMARGQIVSWLNSDDVILPGAVTRAVQAFERNPAAGAVYGEGYLIDADGKVTARFPATEPFNLWKLIYLSDYILQQTVYIRRAVLDDVGFLDEQLHWGLDWDLFIRIGKKYHMEYIPHMMGCLREYLEAKTFAGGHKRFRELAGIMRRHGTSRYPPGYFVYGLDTYQNLVNRYVPSARARRRITQTTHRWINRILNESQGFFSDGWATCRLRYMLPPGSGKLRICGHLPEVRQLEGQTLSVLYDGHELMRQEIPFGDFDLTTDHTSPTSPAPPNIEIRAAKFVNPAKCGLGDDNRKLAYQLRHIGWFD
jgi:glycosyltransferase involved in cell wall biosynthesis